MMPDQNFVLGRELHETHGLKWLLHPNQCIDRGIRQGAWEPQATHSFLRLLELNAGPPNGDLTFFDVGANIGYYSMLMAAHAPHSLTHAFEPMPHAASVLRQHIEINGLYDRIVPHMKIIGSRAGGTMCPNFIASVPLQHETDPNPPGPPTMLTTVDIMVEELQLSRLDFLKVDTDGYEIAVLEGADQTLWEHQPIVLIEVCDYTLRNLEGRARDPDYQYGTLATKLMQMLLDANYELHREADLTRVTPKEVLEETDLSKFSTNLFCWVPE